MPAIDLRAGADHRDAQKGEIMIDLIMSLLLLAAFAAALGYVWVCDRLTIR
jgi:hypothetical protein